MYQGDGAAEKWQREIETCISIRHPNVIQIYGAANWGDIHATIFHGDLLPFKHFMDLYKSEATSYCKQVGRSTSDRDEWTLWIRRPTARLCVDLTCPHEPP
ncbi:hypothetical protein DFH06DRAFT_1293957 [Mycena polygramma]|nr:hypothetical protein DFH06DRAFT_1293957 [Mycena polygramma]